MRERNYERERQEYRRIIREAPANLQPLLEDMNVGQMNWDATKDAPGANEDTQWLIMVSSTYYIVGIYDEEDLQDTYRFLGVKRPEKLASKIAIYVNRRR